MRISFPSIFFILIILTTTLSSHTTTSTIIHDSSGNNLLSGIPYHILPLLRDSGGGLTVTRTTKDSCPLHITQEPFQVNHGVPFTFNPIVLDEHIVREAYPISIEAGVTNPCPGSNIWKVTDKKEVDKKDKKDKKKKHDDDDDDDDKDVALVNVVTTGGEFNKPESCFQIVEDNMMPGVQSYQIQSCPFKCGASSGGGGGGLTCYNVGVVTDAGGNRYLGRTDAVFPVVFASSYGSFSRLGSKMMNTFGQLSIG